ncbi:MAG TPA: hypothetical protein V6C85_10775 [Allocoleopsis sp.]
MNLSTVPLKSAGIAKVLLWLLRIHLTWIRLSTILTLIAIALPATPRIVTTLQHLLRVLSMVGLLLFLVLAILLLSMVWIYRLHKDLRQCYSSYPIDAWDALNNFILPGYNVWGIWNTLMTTARYFKAEAGRLHYYGLLINRFVRLMYGIVIASYLLHRLVMVDRYDDLEQVEPIIHIPDSFVPVAIAGEALLNLGMAFVLLAIVQTIVNAMQLKARQMKTVTP